MYGALEKPISNVQKTTKNNVPMYNFFLLSHRVHGDIASQRVHHVRGFLIHFFHKLTIFFYEFKNRLHRSMSQMAQQVLGIVPGSMLGQVIQGA